MLSTSVDRRVAIDTETRGLTQPITSDKARRDLNRRVEVFVFTTLAEDIPPPPPPPQKPIKGQPPPPVRRIPPPDPVIPTPVWKPPQQRPPQYPTWDPNRWRPPGTTVIPGPSGPGSGIPDWIKTVLATGATALGIVYSGSMWAVRGVTLRKALDAAWLVFQIEEGDLKALVGLAGEAGLEAVLPDVLGIDASAVLNLNDVSSNFPILDLISSRGVYSVKTYGIVSTKVGPDLLDQIVSKYKNDFFEMIFDQGRRDQRMDQRERYLFDHQTDLRSRGSPLTCAAPPSRRSASTCSRKVRSSFRTITCRPSVRRSARNSICAASVDNWAASTRCGYRSKSSAFRVAV